MTTDTPKPARSYGQYCPIAVGLDLLGDRWVLLILRELANRDQRFSDLRRGLPGIAPNLLSERLQSLTGEGLVESVELPPPAARSVYRLTADGKKAIPVLRAVARFGVRYLDDEPAGSLTARRAAYALMAPWSRPTDAVLRAHLVVTHEGDELPDPVDVVLAGGTFRFEDADPETSAAPDITVTFDLDELVAARRTQERGQDPALAVSVAGPSARADDLLSAFGLRRRRRRASASR
jgi:DNA-binding HxlR family transcriptional regulator